MAASPRINDYQVQTRRITGWVLAVVVLIVWISMFLSSTTMGTGHHHLTRTQTGRIRIQSPNPSDHQDSVTRKEPIRVLYVVTSSTEYNSGDKETRKGQDRFLDILVPVVLEST
jgi:hypothetical protein